MPQKQPFSHLKVLELASVLAGPLVGTFFAEMGAEVIKVENKKTGGDVTRTWKLNSETTKNYSAYYCAANYGKKTWFLDLNDEPDRQKIYDYAKSADVVIANFKKGAAEKLKVDQKTLHQINPHLIYAKISGFGEKSARPAFDVVLQAESGFIYMNGKPESGGVKMPLALIDILAAHQLKQGILTALLQKNQTNIVVHVSLLEAAISSLANQATNWLMANHIPQPIGSLHPNIAPYGETFICKNGKKLTLAVGNNAQFVNLCVVLGLNDLPNSPKFDKNTVRVKNREELAAKLAIVFLQKERKTWLNLLEAQNVPVGAIRNMEEVFELPEAQKMILTEKMEDNNISRRVKTVAFSLSTDN